MPVNDTFCWEGTAKVYCQQGKWQQGAQKEKTGQINAIGNILGVGDIVYFL